MNITDVVIFAGTTPWSTLSLCKVAAEKGMRTFCVCIGHNGSKILKSKFVCKIYDNVCKEKLHLFWKDFFCENVINNKPILFTTTDQSCLIVNENLEFYKSKFVVCIPSPFIVKSFNNKIVADKVARDFGLLVPNSMEIVNENDVEYISRHFSFPIIIKPFEAAEHQRCGFKFKTCATEEELRLIAKDIIIKDYKVICQEFIEGEDKNCKFYIFYRNKDGIVSECMGEKTKQTNGIMTIGTTLYDVQLAEICRKFLSEIKYEGIGGIEFKYYNNRYYFIEMSTRTEGFLPISDMASVSIAEVAISDLTNGIVNSYNKQTDGVIYVDIRRWLSDVYNSRKTVFKNIKEFISFLFSRKRNIVNFYFK